MKIEEVMSRDVETCRPTDTLSSAAQRMWDHDCGCIPVVDDEDPRHLVGMLTDRDICMAVHFRDRSPAEVTVGEVMSGTVRTIGPGETLLDAEAVMRDAQVRRLPVVDDRRRLLGIVSIADLARTAARERGSRSPEISEIELGQTLEAICSARARSPIAVSA